MERASRGGVGFRAALVHAFWLLSSLAAPVLAQPGETVVEIVRPAPGRPLFGTVEVEVRIAEGVCVEKVELRVDGRPLGSLAGPPFLFVADVGQENREHHLFVNLKDCDGGTASAELTSPAIHVDEVVELDLQQLYVTVTDGRGRRVLGLPQGLFEVRDEGVRQELVTFASGEIPFVATVLVDASGSMRGAALEVALGGARAFARGMNENDEVQVVLHDDHELRSSGFQRDPEALVEALRGVEAGDGTAVLDHLYSALLELERRQGRRVVVLLSDGWDLHSVIRSEQLEELARSSQALIYWVRLASRRSVVYAGGRSVAQQRVALSAWRDAEGFRRLERRLERLVRRSGGRIELVDRLEKIEPVFQDILMELREQYALGYYPEPRRDDGAWRRVRVDLERAGLVLRAREGYVDR